MTGCPTVDSAGALARLRRSVTAYGAAAGPVLFTRSLEVALSPLLSLALPFQGVSVLTSKMSLGGEPALLTRLLTGSAQIQAPQNPVGQQEPSC